VSRRIRRLRKRMKLRRLASVRTRKDKPRYRRPKARERFFLETAGLYTPLVAVESELGLMCVSPYDRGKSRELFVRGRVDDSALELALQIAADRGRAPWDDNRTFLDVGAHIGLSTVAALRRHGFSSTLSLEPEPENYRLLVANTALNRGASDARTENVAASDRLGTAQLRVNPGMHGKHAIVHEGSASQGDVVSVGTAPLDEVVERNGLDLGRVGFLKIDTEGHEPQVLSGASRLLEQRVPAMVEYAPYRLTDPAFGVEVLERLLSEHYTHFVDLRLAVDGTPEPEPITELRALRDRYTGPGRPRVTDLLLLG
jgi:FkbM family methyltransferase